MRGSSDWTTKELAEFLALLAAAADGEAVVGDTLERLADAFGADAGAFLSEDGVTSSLGWPSGGIDELDLMAAAKVDRARIEVPGIGWCETVAVAVDRQAATRLLLARAGDRFSEREVGLLAGVAQVLALGLRLVGTVAVERPQVDENRDLIASLRERQALEERLARIEHQISSRAPLQQVMDAITSGAAQLLGVDLVALRLVDESDANLMIVVSSIGVPDGLSDELHRLAMGITEPAVAEDRLDACEGHREGDDIVGLLADVGVRSAMAAPVRIEGAPSGALVVGSARDGRVYSQHERDILAAFAEHASLVLNDARTVQALSQALGQATHQSLHDELTGLPNRACFYDRTDQALRQAARDRTSSGAALRPRPLQADQRHTRT